MVQNLERYVKNGGLDTDLEFLDMIIDGGLENKNFEALNELFVNYNQLAQFNYHIEFTEETNHLKKDIFDLREGVARANNVIRDYFDLKQQEIFEIHRSNSKNLFAKTLELNKLSSNGGFDIVSSKSINVLEDIIRKDYSDNGTYLHIVERNGSLEDIGFKECALPVKSRFSSLKNVLLVLSALSIGLLGYSNLKKDDNFIDNNYLSKENLQLVYELTDKQSTYEITTKDFPSLSSRNTDYVLEFIDDKNIILNDKIKNDKVNNDKSYVNTKYSFSEANVDSDVSANNTNSYVQDSTDLIYNSANEVQVSETESNNSNTDKTSPDDKSTNQQTKLTTEQLIFNAVNEKYKNK